MDGITAQKISLVTGNYLSSFTKRDQVRKRDQNTDLTAGGNDFLSVALIAVTVVLSFTYLLNTLNF